MRKIVFVLVTLFLASVSRSVWADDEISAEGGDGAISVSTSAPAPTPAGRSFGVAIGIGDPFPGLVGFNASYNFNKDLRAKVGYAEVEVSSSVSFGGRTYSEKLKAQTYAVGAQYLFTDWSVRPTVGLNAGYFDVSGKGDFEVNGFDESTGYMYSNFGIDWISENQMTLATGLNVAFLGGSGAGFYASAGYLF